MCARARALFFVHLKMGFVYSWLQVVVVVVVIIILLVTPVHSFSILWMFVFNCKIANAFFFHPFRFFSHSVYHHLLVLFCLRYNHFVSVPLCSPFFLFRLFLLLLRFPSTRSPRFRHLVLIMFIYCVLY